MAAPTQSRFLVLRRSARVWAVAAIHGEAQRLAALHDALDPHLQAGDRVVYLGNAMGRGSDVRGAIDELLRFRLRFLARPGAHLCDIAYLRGSQEEMWQKLLQLQMAPNPREVLPWMLDHGVEATVRAYGGNPNEGAAAVRDGAVAITRWTNSLRSNMQATPGHGVWLSGLRHAAYTDDGALLFVNAGLDVARPLSAQGDSFWWDAGGFQTVTEPFEGYRRIVRGYDPSRGGVAIGPVAATIDGGCGVGGPLVAVCFTPDGEEVARLEA